VVTVQISKVGLEKQKLTKQEICQSPKKEQQIVILEDTYIYTFFPLPEDFYSL